MFPAISVIAVAWSLVEPLVEPSALDISAAIACSAS